MPLAGGGGFRILGGQPGAGGSAVPPRRQLARPFLNVSRFRELLPVLVAWSVFVTIAGGWIESSHPTQPLTGSIPLHQRFDLLIYGMIWGGGVAGLVLANLRLGRLEGDKQRLIERLQASEERMRAALDAVGDGLWDWDMKAGTVYFSPSWKKMLGLDESDSAARVADWERLVHPDDLAAVWSAANRHIAGETTVFENEHRLRAKDGTYRWVLARGRIVERADDGSPVRFVGSHIDRTAQHATEVEFKKLSRAVEQSPATVIITDTRGAIEYVNPHFTRATGYTFEEVRGKNPRLLKSGLQPDSVYTQLWEAITAGREWRGLQCNRRKDGALLWVEAAVSPLSDEAGRITHFLAVCEDVTERQAALAALQASENRFRSLVESLPSVAVKGYDAERRVTFWNRASEALYGHPAAAVMGRRLEEIFVPPEKRAAVVAEVTRWFTGETEIAPREVVVAHRDGTERHVLANYVVVAGPSGQRELYSFDVDITPRKIAEAQVREQAALLDVTPDAILVLDLGRRVTFWNRGAERLYGHTRAEAIGCLVEDLVHPVHVAEFGAEWDALLAQGEARAERRHFLPKRGEIVVASRAIVVRAESGQPKSILLVLSDITEAKRVEGQFLRAQRLENLGSLASGVAHDLNNVLTPILMASQLLRTLARQPHERELVQLVADSAKRGADVVQQLLLYGRGANTPHQPVRVAQVVREIGHLMRETFPRSLGITTQCPKDLWFVEGDPTQLHQVLLNLCVNARDAQPVAGRIEVGAENVHVDAMFAGQNIGAAPGPHVMIRVTDAGTGIPSAIIDKIFDPFFTTKDPGKGTGLGLATVLGIVRGHRGFVTVESAEGRGAEFRIYLPARASETDVGPDDAALNVAAGRGELVLVIDDEPSIRTTMEVVLRSAGYNVLLAGDGAEGVALFAAQSEVVRLVITDMMMPVMDGLQAIRALRSITPLMPVIAMGGVHNQRQDFESLFGPGVRFLPKPFTADKALAMVRELIDIQRRELPLSA